MARFYPRGRRGTSTPGGRLLKFLMAQGGSATLWQISRRSNDGRLLNQAQPELEGLIVVEKCGSVKSRRRCTRVFLTMKGWAACAAMRPAWKPQRLPVALLKAWLTELQAERDPWALQFPKDASDAAELKRLRAIGWIRPPLKKRGPPKGTYNAGAFRPKSVSLQGPKDCKTPLPAIVASPMPPPAQPFSDYEQYIRDSYPAPVRTEIPPDHRREILTRAERLGYPTRNQAGNEFEIMFESRWIPAQDWDRLVPDS